MKKTIKKIICYVYLRLKGVDTKYGYCNLVGFPIIKKNERLKNNNRKGCNHCFQNKRKYCGN